jgi:hypothetical protein
MVSLLLLTAFGVEIWYVEYTKWVAAGIDAFGG